jgi:hypothetical protein
MPFIGQGECDQKMDQPGGYWLHTISRFLAAGVILANTNGIAW